MVAEPTKAAKQNYGRMPPGPVPWRASLKSLPLLLQLRFLFYFVDL